MHASLNIYFIRYTSGLYKIVSNLNLSSIIVMYSGGQDVLLTHL